MSNVTADVTARTRQETAEGGGFLIVTRTAQPFQAQTQAQNPGPNSILEEDFIDTLTFAAEAVHDSATDAVSRIQEAMERGSLWDVDEAMCELSGKIIQVADAVAQKSMGSGIGCTADPIDMNPASAVNDAIAGLSRTVEAVADAMTSHLIASEGTALLAGSVVKKIQPNMQALVNKAEKATAEIGVRVQSAFVGDDNQVPESVLRRGDAAVVAYQKRTAEAAARATSPRPSQKDVQVTLKAQPGGPGPVAAAAAAVAAGAIVASETLLALPAPASPAAAASPRPAAAASPRPPRPETSGPGTRSASPFSRNSDAPEPSSPAGGPDAPGPATSGDTSPSAATATLSSPGSAAPPRAGAAPQGSGVRTALDKAGCLVTPLQQLAVASKQAAAAAHKNISEAAGTTRVAVESKLQASVKGFESWAASLPSSGAAAVAALEKLRTPLNQELPQPQAPVALEAEEVVDSLRKKGHEAAAKGDATSAIRFYTAALALAPENHLLRFSRANALLQLGKTAEATRDALVLVRVMPIWSNGWGLCAQLMEADGNVPEAIALYECAKQIAETNEEDDVAAQKYADAIERLQERQCVVDRP